MNHILQLALGLLTLVVVFVGGVWVMWRWLKSSQDTPVVLVVKWIATALILGFMVRTAWAEQANPNIGSAFIIPITGAVCGLLLTFLWVRNLTGAVGGWFSGLFTGGNIPPEARAVYSVAETKRQRGLYHEAIADIRAQLAQYPTDAYGHLLLADILANNLDDLPGADSILRQFCAQPGHAPETIAAAWHQLADLHLRRAFDRDTARAALQEIERAFPNTELARTAAQRIAHLPVDQEHMSGKDSRTIELRPGVEYLGLMSDQSALKAHQETPSEAAQRLVQRLTLHPLDFEAREELARVYATDFKRLDLACDQIDQLLRQPGLSPRQQVRWLTQLVDMQVRGGDIAAADRTLQEIIQRFDGHAAADMARDRLAYLKNEARAREEERPLIRLTRHESPAAIQPPKVLDQPARPTARPRVEW